MSDSLRQTRPFGVPPGALGVLALNVSRPTKERAAELLTWLWHRDEQVLVLSEVAPGAGSDLVAAVCRRAGHTVLDSRRGDYGVLVVGRDLPAGVSLESDATVPDLPVLPQRLLPVRLRGPRLDVSLLAVYGAASDPVRYASTAQRERKRGWLAGLAEVLDGVVAGGGDALLVGDLNVVAPGHRARLPFVLAEERQAYAAWTAGAWVDVVARDVAADAVTWVDHTGAGCRYDHALSTRGLADQVHGVTLDDTPRHTGLSDHSALALTVSPAADAPG